jgi:hypothetical protein
MGLIKKPASATLNGSDAAVPSIPPSTVGMALTPEQVASIVAKQQEKGKDSIKRNTQDLTLTSRMILAQNCLGNIQSSQEWANISIQCKTKEERDAEFRRLANNYYDLALELAQE